MMFTNMAISAEEAAEQGYGVQPTALGADEDTPKYPYGLEISLDDESLKKLNITALPEVGYTFMISALATVTGGGMQLVQDGDDEKNLRLQITDMQLDAPPTDASKIAAQLYGK